MATKKRSGVSDAAAQRLNIRLDVEAYRRLMLHSLMSRRGPGEIVAELIERELREFRVQRNSTVRDGNSDRLGAASQASESEAAAA